MPRLSAIACVLMAVAGAPACLTISLHPVYDDSTLEFDEQLLGTWANKDEQLVAEIRRGEWQAYKVRISDNRREMSVIARLTRVGQERLLDVTAPADPAANPLLLMGHGVYRVQLAENALTVAPLDYDAVRARLAAGQLGVAGQLDDRQNVVLTAPTGTLRAWLVRSGVRAAPFAEPLTFSRVQAD